MGHQTTQHPNGTAYTRWNCHSGLTNPVNIVSTPPAPSNGGPITSHPHILAAYTHATQTTVTATTALTT